MCPVSYSERFVPVIPEKETHIAFQRYRLGITQASWDAIVSRLDLDRKVLRNFVEPISTSAPGAHRERREANGKLITFCITFNMPNVQVSNVQFWLTRHRSVWQLPPVQE